MNNINLKKQKTMATKNPKLIDILKVSEETNASQALIDHVDQASINTQQEILNIRSQVNASNDIIRAALQANPFSASALYKARKEKQLLEMKLEGIKEIQAELF